MESMEQRVWQRVTAGPQAGSGGLDIRPLLLAAQALAAEYGRLLRTAERRQKVLLQRLYDVELANVACLRGMAALSGGGVRKQAGMSGTKEPARKALEKCYHGTRRALVEYTARSGDPEYGAVFRVMADRAQAQCATVVELLGEMAGER